MEDDVAALQARNCRRSTTIDIIHFDDSCALIVRVFFATTPKPYVCRADSRSGFSRRLLMSTRPVHTMSAASVQFTLFMVSLTFKLNCSCYTPKLTNEKGQPLKAEGPFSPKAAKAFSILSRRSSERSSGSGFCGSPDFPGRRRRRRRGAPSASSHWRGRSRRASSCPCRGCRCSRAGRPAGCGPQRVSRIQERRLPSRSRGPCGPRLAATRRSCTTAWWSWPRWHERLRLR